MMYYGREDPLPPSNQALVEQVHALAVKQIELYTYNVPSNASFEAAHHPSTELSLPRQNPTACIHCVSNTLS